MAIHNAFPKDMAAIDALSGADSAPDALETARATAAFKFHLDLHLAKEDTHLYRLIRESAFLADQGEAVGVMSSPLMGPDDRENTTRVWRI